MNKIRTILVTGILLTVIIGFQDDMNANFLFSNQKIKDEYNYVIITIDDLVDPIVSSSFINWKTLIGYSVNLVTISDEEISLQFGVDLSQKIRNFLREYLLAWNIKYVMIVGGINEIPMRNCYFDPNNHDNSPDNMYRGDVPTDYYYADLTLPDSESWDLDGDGFYGEFRNDAPDFQAEVFVGRIPTSNPDNIVYTLNKIVSYEQDTGLWKNNALHAGAIIRFTNEVYEGQIFHDGASVLNEIEKDFMSDWYISHYSEQVGLEKSLFKWVKLTEESFTSDWVNGQYGVVNWNAHGHPSKVGRLIWFWDNGDTIPQPNEKRALDMISIDSNLDDDYPSIVFAGSCLIGYPELDQSGNLGIDLLIKPGFGSAVSIICSSRICHAGYNNWPNEPGGLRSLIYEFNHYLINGPDGPETVGEALFNSKYYCTSNFGWSYPIEYQNMYDLNLYGDPSLRREGVFVIGKPSIPVLNGPSSGKSGDEIIFTAQSNDPDKDNIYYLFDWGTESNSSWIGPFNSSEICNTSNIWSTNGVYEVKVKAKDSNGLESGWSNPVTISMPRYRELLEKMYSLFYKIIYECSINFDIDLYVINKV